MLHRDNVVSDDVTITSSLRSDVIILGIFLSIFLLKCILRMVRAKNCRPVSTFVKVMQKKPWPLFSRHSVYLFALRVSGATFSRVLSCLHQLPIYSSVSRFVVVFVLLLSYFCKTTSNMYTINLCQ